MYSTLYFLLLPHLVGSWRMLVHSLVVSCDFHHGQSFLESDLALGANSADSCSIGLVDTLAIGLAGVQVVDSVFETSVLGFVVEIFTPNFVFGSGSLGCYMDTDILSTCRPLGHIYSRCLTSYNFHLHRGSSHNHTLSSLQSFVS